MAGKASQASLLHALGGGVGLAGPCMLWQQHIPMQRLHWQIYISASMAIVPVTSNMAGIHGGAAPDYVWA